MPHKTRIAEKISPNKLRHPYATNLLIAGAELVDIQVLLSHTTLTTTTQIDTHVGQDRSVVARL